MKLRFVPFSVGLLLVGNTRTAVASLIDALSSVTGSQERRAQHVALFRRCRRPVMLLSFPRM
jgi:hypothetical protein